MTQYIVENKDMIPFKNMSDEDKLKIVNACCYNRDNVQVLCHKSCWENVLYSDININGTYRIKAKATPLNIPWEHIKPEYNWAAMNKSGSLYAHTDEPFINECNEMWDNCGGVMYTLGCLNINTDNANWELSLTKRPDNI